ncbi:sugar transferase [Aquimarina sp. RZ0]|uniref:sugar transferase n=1 Tax=Aquimarina sp. RZ0 TaxID=2607730 RepID=UPI00165FE0E7|nr:sugar transferase [Aquimarina sp. RZ0]
MISKDIRVKTYPVLKKNTKILTDSIQQKTGQKRSKVAIKKIITKKLGNQVCDFITNHIQGFKLFDVLLSDTNNKDDITSSPKNEYQVIVNLHSVNNYRRINKFFEAANHKLAEGGIFINTFETHKKRKERLLKKFLKPFNWIYYSGDFIFHRVFPKVNLTKKLYFWITQGKGRVLTKTEVLGRLYSCGFDLIEERAINNRVYFVAKKKTKPQYDLNPTYGPLISLKRVGKNGKPIQVYKFRTMHPYSEYLQQYVFEKNNLRKGGKLKDDFRISNLGRLFRKYWIDELPMLMNFMKGDLKLVGGRPLSNHYFSLYTKELQEKRIKHKPGLIPPFYADMPSTLDEIIKSEMRYLEEYEKNPLGTDLNYLFRIFKNIVLRGKRSF